MEKEKGKSIEFKRSLLDCLRGQSKAFNSLTAMIKEYFGSKKHNETQEISNLLQVIEKKGLSISRHRNLNSGYDF